MADKILWQLLFVDDEAEICAQIKDFLEAEIITEAGESPQVETLTDFGETLKVLEVRRFDLLILDVRLGSHQETQDEEVGVRTLEAVQKRCFVPVVFYTGLPHLVNDLKSPLVKVVEKWGQLPPLREAVQEIFATRLPAVNRALVRHLEEVQRKYMWEFVAHHWQQFGDTPDRPALAYLLARRLAQSLSGPAVQELIRELGGSHWPANARLIHPMQYYVIPPIVENPMVGYLYRSQNADKFEYWLLLTPSCDLVSGRVKADYVLLARCILLTEQPEYGKWKTNSSNIAKGDLTKLMKNNRSKGRKIDTTSFPGHLHCRIW